MTINEFRLAEPNVAYIGAGVTIKGEISAPDVIVVDGVIEGDVTARSIRVGVSGSIKGNVVANEAEVHGTLANWSTLKAISGSWIADKKIKFLAQCALKKNPEMPDVPLIFEFAKNEADQQTLRFAVARLEYGRPFFLPPNKPADRVQVLRRAFDATMKDPAYLAEADKLKIEVDPLAGEQVAVLVEQVTRTPAELVERVRKAMEAK